VKIIKLLNTCIYFFDNLLVYANFKYPLIQIIYNPIVSLNEYTDFFNFIYILVYIDPFYRYMIYKYNLLINNRKNKILLLNSLLYL